YIKALKKSLITTESKRFNKKNINNIGLDVLDSVHCVYDKHRTDFFLNCINKIVKKGDIVIEAGTGTGILSIMSSVKGAHVYSIELNKKIIYLAKKIISLFSKKKVINDDSIDLIQSNAIKYKPSQKANIIISENIYTGMFYEKQVQIMNNLSRFLKRGGVVIPSGLVMGVILVHANFPHKTAKNELFNVIEYKDKLSICDISESMIYENFNFAKKNKLQVNKKIKLEIIEDGNINGILLWSKVTLPDGKIIGRFDTTFLNNDILFPLMPIKKVKKGNIVKLHIKYIFGSKPKQAIFKIL
ncbi:MAG: 50S ribosomal protein L11 methyltransferase, partial [Candidatus Staskawiczbacteria bacterium]|nr:50S ribosomal protein L11 methyltransferase [Candidatus Staskawiczbacteria bacterium]